MPNEATVTKDPLTNKATDEPPTPVRLIRPFASIQNDTGLDRSP